ncbi:hypothetical protein ACFL5U_02325 [Candidatus Margulisiibacteriota bacterium]
MSLFCDIASSVGYKPSFCNNNESQEEKSLARAVLIDGFETEGVLQCTSEPGVSPPPIEVCIPQEEICDGIDNDCNGETDEIQNRFTFNILSSSGGALVGEEFVISVNVFNSSGIKSAIIHYKPNDGSAWRQVEMSPSGEAASFEGVIPAEDIALPGFDYYIEAIDACNNSASTPATAPSDFYSVDVHLCSFQNISYITGGIVGSPIVADLDNDQAQEIIISDYGAPWWSINDLEVLVYDHDAAADRFLSLRWGKVLGDRTETTLSRSLLVGDLDLDGNKEVVVKKTGVIYALSGDGSDLAGWPIEFGASTRQTEYLALGNLAGEEDFEIVVSDRNSLSVINNSGDVTSGWPQSLPDAFEGHFVTLGDTNNDNVTEILASSATDMSIYDSNGVLLNSFPFQNQLSANYFFTGDVDNNGSLEIICHEANAADLSFLSIYTPQGETLASWEVGDGSIGALGDIDNDGDLEIVYRQNRVASGSFPYSGFAEINIFHHDGSAHPGWPITSPNETQRFGRPIVADISGDGNQEIIAGSGNGDIRETNSFILFYNSDGNLLDKLVVRMHGDDNADSYLAVGNIDGNDQINLISAGYWDQDGSNLKVWECAGMYSSARIDWPMFRHDPQGTNNYETPIE